MAEAVVEDRASVPTRFYCHMCNVEINIPNTDFTCPLCAGGFVEELPATAPATGGEVSASSSTSSVASNAAGAGPVFDMFGINRIADLDTLRGDIATLLMSRNGPNVEISFDPGSNSRRGNVVTIGGPGGGRVRPQNLDRLDNVLFDFLQSISGGDVDTPFGNSQMFFMGNPGDYAWGREGIDTIVTQLLNQMETSGPPPLPKEKIDEIPKVEVTAEEVERKLQCSVCWEDFHLHEIVRKLPCTHLYHEHCIVPWLDLHGTCPICRKSLTDDMSEDIIAENEHLPNGLMDTQSTECPVHGNTENNGANSVMVRNIGGVSTSSRNGASTSRAGAADESTSSQTENQRNNVFAFDDGNVDLD